MYKTWSILFLAACLALQIVASFPQMDAFESFEDLPDESPEIEFYQQRQSRKPDGFDDTRDILNEENSVLKDIYRNIDSKPSGRADNQAIGGDGVLRKILKLKKLELKFLGSLAKKIV